MEIIIDNREKDLIELFEKNNINCIKKNLELGDIQYIINDEIIYIIERKTFEDLGASIKDGRYKEQKMRLLANNKNNIFYILEGEKNNCKTIGENALLGSIINMLFRDNIKIIFSININETYKILLQIKEKYNNGKFQKIVCDTSNYASSIKTNKKENIDKTMCSILQLSVIPGVSKNIAELIIDKYETVGNLIEEFKKNDNLMLVNINLGKRKLGKMLSTKIYDFLI
jgi:crossover junction endonuclease MUS81